MRISDSTKYRQVVSNLQTGQQGLQALLAQTTSGKRIQKPSEDPNAATTIMQARAQLRGIEQYQRNIGVAISRVETEEIAPNQRVPSNHNGKQVFLDSGVLQALGALSDALGSNDADAVRTTLGNIKGASERVADLLGDVGGRFNHFRVTESGLRQMNLSTTVLRSNLEDIDLARALVDLTTRQSAVQATMRSTSRILGLSLTDYVR